MLSERETVVERTWAAGCCPCVEKLRPVLPLMGGWVRMQVAVLRNKLKPLYPGVEIGSVDGFQGREKEAVVRETPHLSTRGG
jgi:hypothetical protein